MSRQAVKFIEKCSMQPPVRSGNGFEPRLQKMRGSVIRFCAVLIELSDEIISVTYESTATPSRYPSQPKQDHNSHLSELTKALKKDYNCFIFQVFSFASERRRIFPVIVTIKFFLCLLIKCDPVKRMSKKFRHCNKPDL